MPCCAASLLGGADQAPPSPAAAKVGPNGERAEQPHLPEQLQPDHSRKTVVVTAAQEADVALLEVSGRESACLEQDPNLRRVLLSKGADDHAWPPQHSLPQQAASTATGLVARTNAPITRPSISRANHVGIESGAGEERPGVLERVDPGRLDRRHPRIRPR